METASESPQRAVRTGSNSATLGLLPTGQREPSGEDLGDLLQVAGNPAPSRIGHRAVPDRSDHLLQALLGDLVVEHVVQGGDRGLVARGEAFLLLQSEQAVLGDALTMLTQD